MTDYLKEKNPQQLTIDEFPSRSTENVRFRDVDCLGHVNNAVFASYLETGRVNILWEQNSRMQLSDSMFVMAHLGLDFVAEVTWPGEVEIGTCVTRIGRSSITMFQAIFQQGRCTATAETVLVAMDAETRRSRPLTDDDIRYFGRFMCS